jgi:hypothetical protein
MPTIVKCEKCDAQAVVKKTVGLLEADDHFPGVRILQVIDCPNCGEREQPKTPDSDS